MIDFALKVLLSALVVAGAAELARRSSVAGALLASLPLTSVLAMVWLWRDGSSNAAIADFASGIFWLVLPSLLLFVVTPLLLRAGVGFWLALGGGCGACVLGYGAMLLALRVWGRG